MGYPAVLLAAGSAFGTNAPLSDALERFEFFNTGETLATDSFFWDLIRPVGESQKLIYLEADNVSCTE